MGKTYNNFQLTWLVILRVFVGWHFLYEGLVKILNPNWSASSYLMDSAGLFGPMFVKMSSNQTLMNYIDFLNEWALVLVGLGLILGCFSRLSSIGGMLLLLLYTMSHPAIIGVQYATAMEGSYFWINKNIVELAALGVLYVFPSGRIIGLDRLLIGVLPKSCQKFIL